MPEQHDHPDLREVHELRDYVAELVQESFAYDVAICEGVKLGRQRATDRTQSDEQDRGEA